MKFFRFVLLGLGLALAGCSSFASSFDMMASMPAVPAAPHGQVYIFRGIGGKMANLDLDDLGERVNRTGVDASVHGFSEWRGPAEEAIRRYEQDPRPAPIVLVGHSAGGDSAISFANRLKEKGIPVSLIVTFDPTRAAGDVPSNVERFVNVYQSTNVFGGGAVKPAADFKGHFATVNLKRYWNVLHVNLLKIDGLKERVVDKITQVTAMPPPLGIPSVPVEYVMPRELPIELFDSGVPVTVERGDNVKTLAMRYAVPIWVISAANDLPEEGALQPGQKLVIPRHLANPMPPSLTSLAPPLE